jgi:hypothetical protein
MSLRRVGQGGRVVKFALNGLGHQEIFLLESCSLARSKAFAMQKIKYIKI